LSVARDDRVMTWDVEAEAWTRLTAVGKTAAAPHAPTEVQLDADVHIAFGLWSGDPDAAGRRPACWAVVTSDRRPGGQEQTITFGESTSEFPGSEMVSDVVAAVNAADGSTWVVVGSKRYVIARELRLAGVPVTMGMLGHNRAEGVLKAVVHEASQRSGQLSGGTKGVPSAAAASNNRRRQPSDTGDCDAVEHYWWPDFTLRSDGSLGSVVVIATDGSADPSGAYASAAVSSRGDVTVKTGMSGFHAATAELEAVVLAVQMIAELQPERAMVLIDSADALAVARGAQSECPSTAARGIEDRVRHRLEAALSGLTSPIEFLKVKGHSGHPLNEAADRIASVGRRAARFPRNDVEAEMERRLTEISAGVRSLVLDVDALTPDAAAPNADPRAAVLSYPLGDRFPGLSARFGVTVQTAESAPAP
jgi:ribonuclease HI